jgi:hypothetical protein
METREPRRPSVQPKPERDPATRIWAELAIIEQGSVGIVRHLRDVLEGRAREGRIAEAQERMRRREDPRAEAGRQM